jgi:hypothetical protein
MRIIGGLLLMIGGFLVTWKAEAMYQSLGPVAWAEEKLGRNGGSRLFYRLLGLGISLVGIMMATNLLESLIFGPITRLFVRGPL